MGSVNVVRVASAGTSTVLFSAKAYQSVSQRIIFNESTGVLRVKFGTGATATSYTTEIAANTRWEVPKSDYDDGVIEGYWVTVNGAAQCTEVTF